MPNKPQPKPLPLQSNLRLGNSLGKSVRLELPPAHPRQFEFLNMLYQPGIRFAVGACGSKFGKSISVEELLPTPSGWVSVGDIKEGDYVFDQDGNPTLVEYVTDVMYGHTCYEVVFSDGNRVKVDAGHLWETSTKKSRRSLDYHNTQVDWDIKRRRTSADGIDYDIKSFSKPVTTQEIKDTLLSYNGTASHYVPSAGALQYAAKNLTIHPYVMGYLLGDGDTVGMGRVACDPQDRIWLMETFSFFGHECVEYSDDGHFAVRGITDTWRKLGLDKGKFIPDEYLQGSIEQRTYLIQGLIDSDGHVTRGQYIFTNTNKDLALGFRHLAESLGTVARLRTNPANRYGVKSKDSIKVTVSSNIAFSRLPRKEQKARHNWTRRCTGRFIVAVNETPSQPVRCLRVSNHRHLFLVGKGCIPTHNTYGTTIAMVKRAWENEGSVNWWVSPTFTQAKMAFEMIKKLLPAGTYHEYVADLKIVLLHPDATERSSIHFKSSDNSDSLRGFGVNFFVMDEAARCSYESFVSLLTTVTQTEGVGYFISTPKGRNWFFTVYGWGEKYDADGTPLFDAENPDPHPEFLSIRMPTWTNPHVKLEAIQVMKTTLPEDVFTQEIGAQFLLDSAGVFRGIRECIRGELEEPVAGQHYTMGVDLARLKDYSVLTVMNAKTGHVVAFQRFNQISWEVQYRKIIDLAKKYKAIAVVDSTGIGDPIVESLQNAGIKVSPYKISGSAQKQQLIDKLRVNIENQKISFPNIPVQRRELENYEYILSPSGQVRFSSPSGQHDDCVISLALANWQADKPEFKYVYRSERGI